MVRFKRLCARPRRTALLERARRCDPLHPEARTGARWIDVHEDDLDEAQMATWVQQAAASPGRVP